MFLGEVHFTMVMKYAFFKISSFKVFKIGLIQLWKISTEPYLTLLVPGDFSSLVYRGGGFFHPPFESDFSPKKGAIFGPEIKFGIIRALN